MFAGVLVLLIAAVMAVCFIVAARRVLYALRRRHDRRMWDDLVSRYQELDRELDEVWRSW